MCKLCLSLVLFVLFSRSRICWPTLYIAANSSDDFFYTFYTQLAFCWWTKGYYDKTVAFWCQICRDTLCASAAAAVKRTNEAKAAEGRSFIVGSTRGAQSRYDDYSKQCRRQGSGVCSLDVSRGHPRCTPSDLVPVAFSTWFLWHFYLFCKEPPSYFLRFFEIIFEFFKNYHKKVHENNQYQDFF